MLKKYVFYFIVVSVLLTVNANAQVPGYRGKRLNLTYDFNFYHNMFKYLHIGEYMGNTTDWSAPRPTFKNGIGLEYVVGRHSSIVASSSIYFGSIPINNSFSYSDNTSWFGFSNDEAVYVAPTEETKIFAYNLGIHYRAYYKNKGLAPLGNFFDFGIERIGYKLKVSDQMRISEYSYDYGYLYPSSTVSSSSIPYTNKDWYGAYLFNLGFGTQRVLYKNISCRYGVKLGWVFGGLLNDLSNSESSLTENNYFAYNSTNHLWNKNLLQLDFGVGYLIK